MEYESAKSWLKIKNVYPYNCSGFWQAYIFNFILYTICIL